MSMLRARRLVENAIETFQLDLSGLVVLTEAATGYYALTPMIAALAGANKVMALTKNSRFGKASDVRAAVLGVGIDWGLANRIEVLTGRADPRIGEADLVTNLGFVRPLNATMLRRLKPTAAVPLMWETWEFRNQDLDLSECRRLGIPVLGTDEHHPDLRIFEYIGHLALKLLYSLDVEVFRSRIAVVGSGEFAAQVASRLTSAGAQVAPVPSSGEGSLESDAARLAIANADAVVIAEHNDRKMLIGPDGEVEADELARLNPALTVAHICGGIDRRSLEAVGLKCAPSIFAPAGSMSVSTDYLGPRPLVDLHTAGLRVGQELARARLNGMTASQAETLALSSLPFAQGFKEQLGAGRSPK